MDFTMPCGCVIEYELERVGEYGYGGEISYHYELYTAEMKTPCATHGGK